MSKPVQGELFPLPPPKTLAQKQADVRFALLAKRAEKTCRVPKILTNTDLNSRDAEFDDDFLYGRGDDHF